MQDTASMVIQQSNGQRTKSDGPETVVLWDQANGLAREGLAHVDGVPSPLDLSVGPHPSHRHLGLVLWRADSIRVAPQRKPVVTGRRLLSQRLMGPILVVGLAKGVKGSLLPPGRRQRWTGGLRLQRSMEPFQASVLLWVTRFDTLRYDTQLDPPYRQRRQASQADAGEGRSVVGPDGPWKSVLSEGTLQDSANLRASGPHQPIADQQIPRGGVLHCERVDPDPVPRAEPPLEVNGPHIVGALSSCERLAPRRSTPAPFPTSYKPCTVQDVPCRAGRRPRLAGFYVSQPRHQLLGSPGWMLPPGRSKPLGHCARGPVGMAMRSSATVPQPLPAICLKAPDTLVAGLATNAKLAAQIHEAYSPCLPSLDEAYLLGFEVRLFPGQHIPPDEMTPIISQCVTHVPGLSVTHVPGLYPS